MNQPPDHTVCFRDAVHTIRHMIPNDVLLAAFDPDAFILAAYEHVYKRIHSFSVKEGWEDWIAEYSEYDEPILSDACGAHPLRMHRVVTCTACEVPQYETLVYCGVTSIEDESRTITLDRPLRVNEYMGVGCLDGTTLYVSLRNCSVLTAELPAGLYHASLLLDKDVQMTYGSEIEQMLNRALDEMIHRMGSEEE